MATLYTRLVLVREDKVAWIESVDFDGSSIVVLSVKVSSWSEILFTKLESGARRGFYSGIPELDTKVTHDAFPANPLTVMETQIYPASVPVEKIFSCDDKFLLLSSVTHASDFGVFMALEKYRSTGSAVLR